MSDKRTALRHNAIVFLISWISSIIIIVFIGYILFSFLLADFNAFNWYNIAKFIYIFMQVVMIFVSSSLLGKAYNTTVKEINEEFEETKAIENLD